MKKMITDFILLIIVSVFTAFCVYFVLLAIAGPRIDFIHIWKWFFIVIGIPVALYNIVVSIKEARSFVKVAKETGLPYSVVEEAYHVYKLYERKSLINWNKDWVVEAIQEFKKR